MHFYSESYACAKLHHISISLYQSFPNNCDTQRKALLWMEGSSHPPVVSPCMWSNRKRPHVTQCLTSETMHSSRLDLSPEDHLERMNGGLILVAGSCVAYSSHASHWHVLQENNRPGLAVPCLQFKIIAMSCPSTVRVNNSTKVWLSLNFQYAANSPQLYSVTCLYTHCFFIRAYNTRSTDFFAFP